MTKKVLIISYYSPPNTSVGGYRAFGWNKYLSEFDVESMLLSRDWTGQNPTEDNLIRVPFPNSLREKLMSKSDIFSVFIRKILTFQSRLIGRFFPTLSFYSPLYKKACDVLQKQNIDLIICTGEPFALFQFGNKLSKKFNIPWIADYRDGWSGNYEFHATNSLNRFKMITWNKFWERKSVASASQIITVSEPLKSDLQKLFPNKNVEIIYNGFFDDISEEVKSVVQESKELTLTYVGTLYPYQRLDIFMLGLKRFLELNKEADIRIRFIGLPEENQNRVKSEFKGIEKYLSVENPLPYAEMMVELRKSNVLLLLANGEIDGSCTKVFDYLSASRKVLLCVNDHGTLQGLINKSNAGVIAENDQDVLDFLRRAYSEFKEKGMLEQETANVEEFGKRRQSRNLASIIKSVA